MHTERSLACASRTGLGSLAEPVFDFAVPPRMLRADKSATARRGRGRSSVPEPRSLGHDGGRLAVAET